jgi:hypothetical protein
MAFGNMVASVSNNEHWVRSLLGFCFGLIPTNLWGLNIGKLYLSLIHSQAAVTGGRNSNSTHAQSATISGYFGETLQFRQEILK